MFADSWKGSIGGLLIPMGLAEVFSCSRGSFPYPLHGWSGAPWAGLSCSWWDRRWLRPPGREPGGCLGHDVSAPGGFRGDMLNRLFFPPGRDRLQWGNVQVYRQVLKKYKNPMIWSAKACEIGLKKCGFFSFCGNFCGFCIEPPGV